MPTLVVRRDGEEMTRFVCVRTQTLVGRDRACDVVLEGDDVSRRHARVECVDGHCTLYSASGTQPIRVAGRDVRHAPLEDGSTFAIGAYEVEFLQEGGPQELEAVTLEELYSPREEAVPTARLSPQMLEEIDRIKRRIKRGRS